MFVVFGNGKCPLCGDAGTKISNEIFHCGKCFVAFNEFGLSSYSDVNSPEERHWN